MTKERKQQAIKLLLQFQGGILDQQVEAVHNHDVMDLINEAPKDD